MTAMNRETEEKLRQVFKQFNRAMILLWRLGLGPWLNSWPSVSGRIMVIVHIGRKTGLKRFTPVNYAIVDDELYCMVGFGRGSDWYQNIVVNPQVELWLPDGWWSCTVKDVSNSEARVALIRQVLIGSGLVAPMFGLNPRKLPDEALDAVTADYRLLHVGRDRARTGQGGPGDLAWIWPLTTAILLCRELFRRKR